MWPGGAQGTAPSGSQATKDSRPLRDRQFQAKMRQDVVTWLLDNGLNYSPQVLQQITSKDFRTIFQDLVKLLDPEWPFTEQKFEDQFVQSLRALRYPYLGQLDIRTLTTPGAMHTWPLLLGVLHWLAELGRVGGPCNAVAFHLSQNTGAQSLH